MFKEALKFLNRYTKTFRRSLPFIWKAAPKETILMIAGVLLQGIVPAISISITKRVVDTVTIALNKGEGITFELMAGLVAAWVGALLLQVILRPWMSAIQGNLGDKLTAHINLLLMRKADNFIFSKLGWPPPMKKPTIPSSPHLAS